MGANDMNFIGQSIRRKEDVRFLTDAGQYTDEVNPPHHTHAYFLRSPHAHANIGRIDLSKAKNAPGVVAIYTGAITDWSDVGGVSGKIRPLAREPGSAVRSQFESYFFKGMKPTYASGLVVVYDANATIDAIRSFKDAIGMLSMSAQAYDSKEIRLIAIDGVAATRGNVANGTYKLLRPLYFVYNPDPTKVRPGIKAFLEWVQSPAGQQVLAGL